MGPVFADTFYWVALTNVKDAAHERAKTFSRSSSLSSIVTTEVVLVEYLNYFAAWGSELRLMALTNTRGLRASSTARVVPYTVEAFQDGLALYAERPDKGYSLTDCISMETMRREGLTQALTNDRHFEQEGFRALFRD